MEVWITRQEEKHRRYLPGILLESILIFLVNGVGTFALLHTLIPSVNGIPFLVSVAVTALFCGFQKNPAGGNSRIFCSSVCHAAFTSSLPASDSRDRYARSTRSAKPAEEKPQNTVSLAALPNLRRKSLSVRRLHSFTENSFSSE